MMNELACAIKETLLATSEEIYPKIYSKPKPANVTDALFAISKSIDYLARAVDRLGNGNAATEVGAIEGLGMHLSEKLGEIADAITKEPPLT